MKNVIILRGIPGSGKSRVADILSGNMAQPDPLSVVSADHWFEVQNEDGEIEYRFDPDKLGWAHQNCFLSFIESVQENVSLIIVDNTNISAAEIAPYMLAGESYGYNCEIINVPCDAKVASKRNVHGVPADIIRDMAKRMKEEVLPPWWTQVNWVDSEPKKNYTFFNWVKNLFGA